MGEGKFYAGGVDDGLTFTPTSSDNQELIGNIGGATDPESIIYATNRANTLKVGDEIDAATAEVLALESAYDPNVGGESAIRFYEDNEAATSTITMIEVAQPGEDFDPSTATMPILNIGTFELETLPRLTVTTTPSNLKGFADCSISPSLTDGNHYTMAPGNILDDEETGAHWLYPGVPTENTDVVNVPDGTLTPRLAPVLFTKTDGTFTLIEVDENNNVVAAVVLTEQEINWNTNEWTSTELNAMTKEQIYQIATLMGYTGIDMSMTKDQMITEFLEQQQR